jgi:hypothetical protein
MNWRREWGERRACARGPHVSVMEKGMAHGQLGQRAGGRDLFCFDFVLFFLFLFLSI